MKKPLLFIFTFLLAIWITFATVNNFLKTWKNWDANVSNTSPANDVFTLSWRLNIEDSKSYAYKNWYRWEILWTIESDLFWTFNIQNKLDLKKYKLFWKYLSECWTGEEVEIYSVSGVIKSKYWWEMLIDNSSYFCSNQYIYIKFKSNTLWEKELWELVQNNLVDVFDKQQISIWWTSILKWDLNILERWNNNINKLSIYWGIKSTINKNLNKNIFKLFQTFKKDINKVDLNLNLFPNIKDENYYLYDYSSLSNNNDVKFNWSYINKWKNLQIWNNWNGKIKIDWKQTVIVKSWNIYIKSNLYNKDKNSLLVLVAKRDKKTKRWWNIYIDSNVTNIDAVLIADWSLISIGWNYIQSSTDSNQKNNIRKQLLIYGSILSSNNVWTDEIPYWSDYYEHINYPDNKMNGNIYNLANLRTFNLNYWKATLDKNKLVPIDWKWWYLQRAWAWKCEWYNWENCDADLRKSDKLNSVIIEYNNRIKFLNLYILKSS